MEADIVVDDESVEDVPTEDVTVENVAVDDVAIEDEVVEDAEVEDVENIANASALNNTQPQLNVEENSDSKQVDDEIRPLADEQNQENESSKEDDKVTKVMEIFTDAPQNSGDGGNLNVEMSKHTENHTNPGHSNINIKKRRNVHILIFDKREILPRKSKTKAYEYLKNIARGFSAAANAGDRRRMQRKRLIRNLRANKASPSRKRNDERKPPAKRIRIGVRNSGTSISSEESKDLAKSPLYFTFLSFGKSPSQIGSERDYAVMKFAGNIGVDILGYVLNVVEVESQATVVVYHDEQLELSSA